MKTLRALSLLAPIALSGCYATKPSIARTGEPLRVDIQTNKEVHYENNRKYKPGEYEWLDGLYQGDTRLEDELDFYHVAGDTEKTATLIEHREKKNFASLVSWGGGAVGAGLLLGSLGYIAATGNWQEDRLETFIGSPEGQAVFGAMVVGGLVLAMAPTASFMFLGPKTDTHVEYPAAGGWSYELMYSRAVAAATADAYNASLASAPASTSADDVSP